MPTVDAKGFVRPRLRPIDLGNISWSLAITGELVTLKANLIDSAVMPEKKRGVIRGFSRGARLRMLKMVASVNWDEVKHGLFMTLTWPDECWPMKKEARGKCLYLFFRNMEKHLCAEFGCLWRCEWKKRKTGIYKGKLLPHFHLIAPGVRYVHRDIVRKCWRSALQHQGPLSTDVRRLQDRTKHAVYIAKYAAKLPSFDSLDYVAYLNIDGRHWGYHRRKQIPMHPTQEFHDLPPSAVARLRHLAFRTLRDYQPEYDMGFSLFGKFGAQLVEKVSEIVLDEGCVQS
jgi:hypothetical protein